MLSLAFVNDSLYMLEHIALPPKTDLRARKESNALCNALLQDIEAVDPEYYKNLKWMLENNITDVLDLTFTEESDYFGKKELVELKPGGKDIRSACLTVSHVNNGS